MKSGVAVAKLRWIFLVLMALQVSPLFGQGDKEGPEVEEGPVQVTGRREGTDEWELKAHGYSVGGGTEYWRLVSGVAFPFEGEVIFHIGETKEFGPTEALRWLRNPAYPPKATIPTADERKYAGAFLSDDQWPTGAGVTIQSFKVYDLSDEHVGYWTVRERAGVIYEAMALAEEHEHIGFPLRESVRAVPIQEDFGKTGSPKARLRAKVGGNEPFYAARQWVRAPLQPPAAARSVRGTPNAPEASGGHTSFVEALAALQIEEGPVDVIGRNGQLLAVGHRPDLESHVEWWESSSSLGIPFRDYASLEFLGKPRLRSLRESGDWARDRAKGIPDARTRITHQARGAANDWVVSELPSFSFLVVVQDPVTKADVLVGIYTHREVPPRDEQETHVESCFLIAGNFPFDSKVELHPLWDANTPDPLSSVAGAHLESTMRSLLVSRGVVIPAEPVFGVFVATFAF